MRRFLMIYLPIIIALGSIAGTLQYVSPGGVVTGAAASTFEKRGGVVGVTCVASPYCPDCNSRGNVCRGVKEFFPGITALAAKKIMIDKCRRANSLDYCGGSYGCVRNRNWTPREAERYRAQYGGGCYKQCDKSVICYIDSR